MKTHAEKIQAHVMAGAAIVHARNLSEGVNAGGLYTVSNWRPTPARLDEYIWMRDRLSALLAMPAMQQDQDAIVVLRYRMAKIPQELVFEDTFRNTVVTEGKNALLTHFLKGSSYTASQVLGLLEDTGYSAIAAGNTAANITAAGGGSPTNGWNEAQSSTCAARQTPSFGTASSGSLAATATSHSILATDTIKGAFLLCRSTAGTAPSTTVGNTSGALYSAGLFSGGDKAVANADTLNCTYTASA